MIYHESYVQEQENRKWSQLLLAYCGTEYYNSVQIDDNHKNSLRIRETQMDKNKIKILEANGWRISYDPNDFLDDIENDPLPLISQVEVPDPSCEYYYEDNCVFVSKEVRDMILTWGI